MSYPEEEIHVEPLSSVEAVLQLGRDAAEMRRLYHQVPDVQLITSSSDLLRCFLKKAGFDGPDK